MQHSQQGLWGWKERSQGLAQWQAGLWIVRALGQQLGSSLCGEAGAGWAGAVLWLLIPDSSKYDWDLAGTPF